ncbi:MAG TPA: roadblock/LC7 domain-containing protein [candidate division Zixibacteria bacterium]|nr:roadblock/LC7 domain-containing protein [candidate division Zixibacteria bacterium]
MYETLSELNKTSGVTGSMIVGEDGIIIAADLDESVEEEAVGALAASISSNIRKSLDRLNATPLKDVTVEAQYGKLFMTDVGIGILVVTTEPNVNMGLVRLEMKNAADKIAVTA